MNERGKNKLKALFSEMVDNADRDGLILPIPLPDAECLLVAILMGQKAQFELSIRFDKGNIVSAAIGADVEVMRKCAIEGLEMMGGEGHGFSVN